MNVPWENAHGGALYCLIRGDEFSAWHRLLFQRPGCAESVLACRHFLDGSPVARCSYPEEYHPCVISRIALLCDSVGWTADVERISSDTTTDPVLAWLYVLDAWEGGLPSARYLGVMADAAEIAGAPSDYVHDLRTRPARNIGPGTIA